MRHQSDHKARARLRYLLVLAAVVCLPLLAVQSATSANSSGERSTGVPDRAAAAAAALAKVQHPDGSPRTGHDPTTQRQVRLEESARRAQGLAAGDEVAPGSAPARSGLGPNAEAVNHGTHAQARDVPMGKAPVKPEEVLPGDGLLVNGCVAGYGRGGACLPSAPRRAADRAASITRYAWKCSEVRKFLPAGIEVDRHEGHAGHGSALVDPLRLDSNRDGVACGPGDR